MTDPVALGIQPPPPMFDTLNSILGIQQKKQALQLQGQELQQQQLVTQQNQGLNQFFTDWKPGEHLDANGVLDLDSAHKSSAYQNLPGVARAAVDERLNNIQNGQLANMRAKMGLNQDAVEQFGQVAQAGATGDPQAALDEIKKRAALSPAFAQVAQLHADAIAKLQNNPKALQQAMASWGAQTQAVLANRLQPGTNAAGQGLAVNPQDQSATLRGGPAPNPTTPQVAGAATRQTATGNADVDTATMVANSQRDAKANIDLTKRIDQLADIVNPGTAPDKLSKLLGATGLTDVNQARTELAKDLSGLKANLSDRAKSDTRAGPILDSLPDETKPTQTIHQAMDRTRGLARQDLALGQLRDKVAKETGGQMNGFQGEYAHATAAASPLMHEYLALSPQEQVGFFRRNFATKEQAKAFRDQAEAVRKRSPDAVGQ